MSRLHILKDLSQDLPSQGEDLLASMVNTIPLSLCVIDVTGNLVAVNEQWKNFGRQNLLDETFLDDLTQCNYLDVCEKSDDEHARGAAEGIRDVINGRRDTFSLDYPCHSPDEKRWFQMEVRPFETNGTSYFLITHVNVTQRKKREQKLEKDIAFSHQLSDISSSDEWSDEDKIRKVLELGSEYFGTDVGFVTRIADEELTIRYATEDQNCLQVGESIPLDSSYCRKTLEGDGTCMIQDAFEEGYGDDPAYQALQMGCYVGRRYKLSDQEQGTVCFLSESPISFSNEQQDRGVLRILTQWIRFALQRMDAYEKVEEQKRRFETLFDDAPIGFWEEDWSGAKTALERLEITEPDRLRTYLETHPEEVKRTIGNIDVLMVNKEAVDITGGEEKQQLRNHFDQLLTKDAYESIFEDLLTFWSGSNNHSSTMEIDGFDEKRRHISRETRLLSGHEEDWSRVFVSYRDVTEFKEMEQSLRESETRFKQLTENINEVFWMQDADSRDILYVSPAVEEIWGEPPDAFYEDRELWLDMVHPEDRQGVQQQFESVEEGAYDMEYRIRHSDGTVRWIHDHGSPVKNETGDTVRLVGSARDITERKQVKNESQMKSNFVSRVTHDLRTPLNSITGMGTLLMNTEITSKQQGHLRTILNAARNMERLTNDILDLDRIERGDLSLNEQHFTLTSVLGEVVSLHGTAVDERDLMLTTEVGEHVPEHLIGDPNRLRQILHNLVDNAVRHTQEGTITISVDVRGEDSDEGTIVLEFAVKDTGEGIPEEKREGIFEQHEQARAPGQTQSDNGLGLGLSICRELVHLMDGDISVESEEGVGSTFSFTAQLKEGKESSVVDYTELDVLLVDDNEHVRNVFRTYLEEVGVTVSECESGNDALKELDGSTGTPSYDVVFMDLQMDSMSGIEVVRTLSEAPNGLDTERIFVVTGSPGEDVKAQLGSVPIAGVLEKPLNESDVLNAVKLLTGESDRTEPMDLDGLIEQIRQIHPAPILTIVVEDNTESQELMKEFLEPFAKEVIIVTSGREGVDRRFEEPEPDLMTLDFELPDLNGIDAIKEIRREESARNISSVPIIAQTAMAMTHVERKFMEAGADRFLRKPINQDKLYRAIRDVFQDKQSMEQFNGSDS